MHPVDLAIIGVYFLIVVVAGVVLSKRAAAGVEGYFLAGRSVPWYLLGISNASGMFDISGTMWMVMLLFVYGLKSTWIPWVWPMFNQIFMMVFLAAWVRRSNAVTGADWLRTRFGKGAGLELAHVGVVLFAFVAVIASVAVAFVGVGKFAETFLPDRFTAAQYATMIMSITALYVVVGGMYSVVFTDVMQFVLLTIASIMIGLIAMSKVSGEAIAAATPSNWESLWFGWKLDLDWSVLLPAANEAIANDGYLLFGPFVAMALIKGVLSSIAGPSPGYDMQRVLAARDDRDASLMSGVVSLVLFVPRYFLIGGITALALIYYSDTLRGEAQPDYEQILPYVIENFVPIGLSGILLAGLFAAFMSTFDSTVNSGAAYLVIDVFKRYCFPQAGKSVLMTASYVASILIVIGGILVGWNAGNINATIQWIVGGLFGGYAAPNMLKWIWWRLNGFGYFFGTLTGVVVALALTQKANFMQWLSETNPAVYEWLLPVAANDVYLFPLLLIASGAGAVIGSWLTPADDEQVLKDFYRNVRPWGFWAPIRRLVEQDDPTFQSDANFGCDMFNCAIGITWQVGLCALPVFVVIRRWPEAIGCLVVIAVTMVVLKFNWYDRLEQIPRRSSAIEAN